MARVGECWARDGIQAEKVVPTQAKLAVIEAAGQFGADRVERTSFARPDVWPQFADAADVIAGYRRQAGVDYVVYVPNLRGYERLAAIPRFRDRVDSVLVAVAVTDSYNQLNVRRDTATAIADICRVIEAAAADGLDAIGCVGTAWACPIEGPVAPARVLALLAPLAEAGATSVMLGDTTGEANPATAAALIMAARAACALPVTGHFHDMRGSALANAVAAIDAGADYIDCALGGVGGHPPDEHQAAPAGNLCTEDFVTAAAAAGLLDGIDIPRAITAGQVCEAALGRQLQSRVQRSGLPWAVGAGVGATEREPT